VVKLNLFKITLLHCAYEFSFKLVAAFQLKNCLRPKLVVKQTNINLEVQKIVYSAEKPRRQIEDSSRGFSPKKKFFGKLSADPLTDPGLFKNVKILFAT
jgi:hypothetical protein